MENQSSKPPIHNRRSVTTSSASARTGIREFMRRGRQQTSQVGDMDLVVEDPYHKTFETKDVFRKKTAYCYAEGSNHYSPYDKSFPETPSRCLAIDQKLENASLKEKLHVLTNDDMIDVDEMELLSLIHSPHYVKELKEMCLLSQKEKAEQYDSIYFNGEETYIQVVKASMLATTMAELIAKGIFQNGFANVRPPGHHATTDCPNGYCFLNNVAIAAKYLLTKKLAKKVLIVDIDVHHGQGTQRAFYDSNEVLYVSIHRYENGKFWPHLRESDFDYVGENRGQGFNVNIPLNETGLTDTDYLAIFINIILPLAYEFNPCIVIVSGGYDACIGCPKGEMNVSPAFYAHMVSMLSALAGGKLLVVLEGGYYLDSLAEGALITVKALLNFACPKLEQYQRINLSVVDTINNVKIALCPYWKCFKDASEFTRVDNINDYDRSTEHVAVIKYCGTVPKPPFPLVDFQFRSSLLREDVHAKQLIVLTAKYSEFTCDARVGFMVNKYSNQHSPHEHARVQEVPKRLDRIVEKLRDFELDQKMIELSFDEPVCEFERMAIRKVAQEYIARTHASEWLEILRENGPEPRNDLYWTDQSLKVCEYSCAVLIHLIHRMKSHFHHVIGVIRPPGHHATRKQGGGFCLINNVVVAANFAKDNGFKKILIVDFDVHHGDGTQDLTYERDDIMYISMHRFDKGKYFPHKQDGNYDRVGVDKVVGFNANIAFEDTKLGNVDYLHTWINVVLPLAYAFDPDLIFVSAGFDAGFSDPLGGYKVFPEMYGHMVHLLKSVAPIVLALEGGYHLETTALSMVNCVRALQGHPLPAPTLEEKIRPQTLEAIRKSIGVLKPYWPILEVNKALDPEIRGNLNPLK